MNYCCPYCGKPARRVKGDYIYPHRPDLSQKDFLCCDPCQAWVGCHRNGKPLGRLANASLRKAKMAAHAAFDPFWKEQGLTRSAAYDWLSKALELDPKDTHIGMMDEAGCARVIAAVKARQAQQPPKT